MNSNNPANLNSQAAKKAGLSYWSYMSKTYPGKVQNFVWGVKKVSRKQKRENQEILISTLATSNNPRMRILSQMRALLGRNRVY